MVSAGDRQKTTAMQARSHSPPSKQTVPPEPPFHITLHVNKLPEDHTLRETKVMQKALEASFNSLPTKQKGKPNPCVAAQLKSGDYKVTLSGYPQSIRQALADPDQWLRHIDARITFSIPHSTHTVAIHKVHYDMIDNPDLLVAQIEELLKHNKLHCGVAMIRKPTKNARRLNQRTSSVLVTLTSGVIARELCQLTHLDLPLARASVEAWTPLERIRQCQKCAKFGHHHDRCSNNEICLRCAGSHSTRDCSDKCNSRDPRACQRSHKCANCGAGHPAWHKSCTSKEAARIKLGIKPRRSMQTRQTAPDETQEMDLGATQRKARLKEHRPTRPLRQVSRQTKSIYFYEGPLGADFKLLAQSARPRPSQQQFSSITTRHSTTSRASRQFSLSTNLYSLSSL